MSDFLIQIGAIVGILAVFFIFRRLTLPRIKSPVLGLLNLAGEAAGGVMREDIERIAPLFEKVEQSDFLAPRCHVLLLYAILEPDGSIRGDARGYRELVRDSGAAIAILANDNPAEHCQGVMSQKGFPPANIVVILSRRGDIFGTFFAELFSRMKRGVSMPVAWNQLAPQYPGADHTNVPDALFLCEGGQIAFK